MPLDPGALGLPHREPFLFIDTVVGIRPGHSADAEKTFTAEDPVFRGHFPGDPIVPGVLLIEALAQTAGLASAAEGAALRLAAVKAMKFPGAARPAQRIELRARVVGRAGGLWQCEVEAACSHGTVASGVIVLGTAPAPVPSGAH
jgi:3-hydroxyacyl-[acyl-carrier-protein] dehydratase